MEAIDSRGHEMTHLDRAIATGITPEQAAADEYANAVQFWRNRESPMYGRLENEAETEEN